MAGDWIKIETGLAQKPEVMRMADILDIDEVQVVGHLVLFWSWCDANMSRDCPDVIGTKRGLDRAASCPGFVDALLQVGWLHQETVDGQAKFVVPNFDHHLSKSAKTRANEQKKKRGQRTRKQELSTEVSHFCPDTNGTKVGPEKRREEKSIIYTPGPDVFVPKSVNTPEVIHAVGSWVRHLDVSHPEKAIVSNSPQEEAVWKVLADWRISPQAVVARINECIAGGWSNLRKPDSKSATAATDPSKWPEVVQAVSKLNMSEPYSEILAQKFGPDIAAAVKRIGVRKIAQADEFQLNQLRKQFASEVNA